MRQRDPFGEAVTAVRDRVRTGRLPPGEPLVVEDLARDLGLSATPVREALAHLSGRGVIEGRRAAGRGYAAWPIAGDVLADLYRFQGVLASFALERAAEQGAGQVERTSQASTDAASRAEAFFDALARSARHRVLLHIHTALGDRLHLARRVEHLALPDTVAELAALEAFPSGAAGLPVAIGDYIARRVVAADHIARAAMQVADEGWRSSI